MTENTTLTGIELRKAALEAARWTVRQGETDSAYPPYYGICSPDGHSYLVGEHYWQTEVEAWQRAPAVESSVDAALEWLTLPEGYFWDHKQGVDKWLAVIDHKTAAYTGVAPKLSVAMCQAYVNLKGGGG